MSACVCVRVAGVWLFNTNLFVYEWHLETKQHNVQCRITKKRIPLHTSKSSLLCIFLQCQYLLWICRTVPLTDTQVKSTHTKIHTNRIVSTGFKMDLQIVQALWVSNIRDRINEVYDQIEKQDAKLQLLKPCAERTKQAEKSRIALCVISKLLINEMLSWWINWTQC